jgi:hypothetical protein
MKKRCALEWIQCLKLKGFSACNLLMRSGFQRDILLWRAGFVKVRPYPNRAGRRFGFGGRE